jgi:anti-sigma regulatory factor (Ser/Thr protein kinase)
MTFRPTPLSRHLALTLPADGGSVAEARAGVRAHLSRTGCGADLQDTVVLLVSELFTNALRHTASTTIGCVVHAGDDHVRIEVRGQGSGSGILPGRGDGDGLSDHGRGLHIVETLSLAWGVHGDGRGHTVWCLVSAEDVRNQQDERDARD